MKMPEYRVPFFRSRDLAAEIAAYQDRTRRVTARASELLKISEPDTFLGRQHYLLIPPPDEDE
jgi:hypothetical protein